MSYFRIKCNLNIDNSHKCDYNSLMNSMKNKITYFFIGVVALLIGTAIYIVFRKV